MSPNNDFPFSLSGKTIFVTGASSGIGRSIAIECSKQGASLYITGRNAERLEETRSFLKRQTHFSLKGDLTNENDVVSIVDQLNPLDGAVFSAGINDKVLVKYVDKGKIDKMFNTNVFGPMLLVKELVKQKKLNNGASIVFISSISSSYAAISNTLYASSKGAIESYIKVLALELSSRKIRVNGIRPGIIDTPLLKGYALDDELSSFEKQIPLSRIGSPEDIAYGAVYLLSEASSWVTGSILTIDGGITLR